ncbi:MULTISPECIES: hypothetical protein [Rhizobium]|uniref:ATP-binding protein n=1 Tax=Rhizobium leguminosarum TaxID=384 RepID=A0A1B1CPJ0_RHILE|nr:hypothetical protein [Rhizobium leguminosarum]ANP91695.1 hypothetical protein BA011_37130 [Rhizobium leguminosarum]API56751.1 hypothetical protein BMW22_35520 [Rhizobium leguminosarum]
MASGVEIRDRLAQSAMYDKVEAALSLVNERSSGLTVPNKWAFEARAGGSVSGAQLAITWSRRNEPDATLHLNSDVEPEHAAETLLARTYGLIAASFADRIIGRDGSRDVTAGMLRLVSKRLNELYTGTFDEIIHGQSLPLVSIDHLERDGPNPFLYHPRTGEVLPDFTGLVRQALLRLIKRNRLRIEDVDAGLLASLFRELFSNTHLHARTDLEGALYPRSARGIVFALRPVDIPHDAFSAGLTALREYIESMERHASRPRVEFLEVSVFDSGPGLAARSFGALIPAEMPIREEYDLVHKCFLKSITTVPNPAHGWGLPRVMHALKSSGGLMRLRTGRLSLCKWFHPGLEEPRVTDDDLQFIDIGGGPPGQHARVEGAVFTILIPIGLGN